MRRFWETFGGQIAAYAAALAVVGGLAYVAWRKLFGPQTPSQLVKNVTDAAATIPSGLESLVESKVKGESAEQYITDAEMRRRAQANYQSSLGVI